MSLPEIIPSNLPQFTQNRARTSFSNSVVPSGSVLLFAESDGNGGSNLIAKNPDGSFTEVGGGGAMDFYKCASVDTVNQTWTGYKAVLNNGVYSFESTATSGLAYTTVTPSVGDVYSSDVLISATLYEAVPGDSYVYLPLDRDARNLGESGEVFQASGTVSYTNDSNILCASISGSGNYIEGPVNFSNTSAFTLCTWIKCTNTSNADGAEVTFGGGNWGDNGNEWWIYSLRTNGSDIVALGNGTANSYIFSKEVDVSKWHHVAFSFTSGELKFFVDGIQEGSEVSSSQSLTSAMYLTINSLKRAHAVVGYGKYADVRLYKRVLSAMEIQAIANLWQPTDAESTPSVS